MALKSQGFAYVSYCFSAVATASYCSSARSADYLIGVEVVDWISVVFISYLIGGGVSWSDGGY